MSKQMKKRQVNILDELIVDNFAGGGGASTGIELALGRPVDIAVNHDPAAIAMHEANHPLTQHFCESVWDIDPVKATQGRPVALCWFSPDCKHFSKAKGGKPVDKNIRGLAWILLRWAAKAKPRVIILENVEEFRSWGPVRRGQPVKSRAGETFRRWVGQLESLGYKVEWRELVAADYGAPTIRKRFFLIARRDGQAIVWPESSHAKDGAGGKKPWRSAAEIIDWSLPCPSIFATKKEIKEQYGLNAVRPLAEATMRRVARGTDKFVIKSGRPFIVQCNHSGGFRGQDLGDPLQTVTGKHGYGVVTSYLTKFQQNSIGTSPDNPVDTVMAGATRFGMIAPVLVGVGGRAAQTQPKHGGQPLGTTTSKADVALIAPSLIQYHQEQGDYVRGQDVERPILTVDAANRYGLTAASLIKYYGQGADLHRWPQVRDLLNKHCGYSIADDEVLLLEIGGILWFIADVGLRMLTPRELYNANGFPPDYIIDTDAQGRPMKKSDQVARCGNAVPPQFAEALCRANLLELAARRKLETMEALMDYMAM